ncbi:SDR family oxidoreductase [Actinocorallia aurea]
MALGIDLAGRVVLLTGGTRGVGAGVARTFLEAGAVVETCGRTVPEHSEPGGPRFTAVDVRDEDQVARWVAQTAERNGRIDVVVNNAGGGPFTGFASASPRFHRRVTDLNFLSAVFVSQFAHRHLEAADGGGSVINITSISARRASPGTAVYGAAKAALESLTRSLAVEWAPRVRVNAVSCGLIETEASEDHYGDAESRARVAATIPRGVFGTPADVGAACALLASPLAGHISGAVLNVDGGGEWPAFLQHAPGTERLAASPVADG